MVFQRVIFPAYKPLIEKQNSSIISTLQSPNGIFWDCLTVLVTAYLTSLSLFVHLRDISRSLCAFFCSLFYLFYLLYPLLLSVTDLICFQSNLSGANDGPLNIVAVNNPVYEEKSFYTETPITYCNIYWAFTSYRCRN